MPNDPWAAFRTGAPVSAAPSDPIIKPRDPYKDTAEQRANQDQALQQQAAARASAADKRSQMEWNATHNPDGSPKDAAADKPYSQSAIDAFDRAIKSGERLKKHPGLGAAVGSAFDPASWGSYNPISGKPFGGTNAANFDAELAAMKAQVFLPMVQSMKGMGALSNAEGQKLTDAIGALDTSMSEDAFTSSLDRIIGDLKSYKDRGAKSRPAAQPSGPKIIRYDAKGNRIP